MLEYSVLKAIHMTCAFISISGFCVRGVWLLNGSSSLQHTWVKRLPHFVDSLLLFTAILMLFELKLNPFLEPWLTAKIIFLFLYILFGLCAFRFSKTQTQKVVSLLAALLSVAYIVQTAFTKNPWVFF